jgi:hypothetical protein
MNHTILRLGTISALMALGGAAALKAQSADTYDPFMKLHVQAGSKTDEGQRNAFGVGFGTNVKLGTGSLGLELAYLYTPGQETRGAINPPSGVPANQTNSVYTLRHSTDAIGLRASYSQPFAEEWSWQVGAGVMHTKDRLETIGDFEYTPGTAGTGYAYAGYANGTWNNTPEKSGFSFQPYAGVIWRLSDSGSLEFNVTAVSVQRQEAAPVFTGSSVSYAGVLGSFPSKSYTDVRLEVGYTFHF